MVVEEEKVLVVEEDIEQMIVRVATLLRHKMKGKTSGKTE